MKKYMMKGLAAVALLIAAAGCSHESDYTPPTQEEALNNATEKLGVDIDPYQDWNMTASLEAKITVALGLDQEYTVAVYDKNPLFNSDVHYYTKAKIKDGETINLKLDVPSADSVFYAAVFDSKYRRIVQSAYVEDSLLTMNFGKAEEEKAENRSWTRAAETDDDAQGYAKTLNDYLNPFYVKVNSWDQVPTVDRVSMEEMKTYTIIDDDIVGSKFQGRSLQNPAYNSAGQPVYYGDMRHYRVPANVELKQSFSTNGYSGIVNGLVLYIEGKVHLVGTNSLNDITLVVADGGEIILDAAENHMSNQGRFIVCPGGKITGIDGAAFNVNNCGWCYNAGTINYKGTLNLNGSRFYNNNTINVDILMGTSGGTHFTNFGHIKARTNALQADAYNQDIVNGCYMEFTENAAVGGLIMLKNSCLTVGGQLYITGNGLYGEFRNELHHLSMITAGSIKANAATIYGPTANDEFAVVKVGSVYANNNTDLQTANNLYMDWDPANFYYHWGGQIDNSNTYMYGLVNSISKWSNESNSTFTIPRGDCTGAGYHDTSAVPSPTIPGSPAVWTYAFEDTPLGDYDMNDVVIKVCQNAEDEDMLDVTLCCTGASFSLYVYLNDTELFAGSGKEVHKVFFGQDVKQFVNTVNNGIKVRPVTETIKKPANFSFETADFWIKSPLADVHVARQGEDPHGIAIPCDWTWPHEYHCIKDAYPNFVEFAKDAATTDKTIRKWYETTSTNPVAEHIYTPED